MLFFSFILNLLANFMQAIGRDLIQIQTKLFLLVVMRASVLLCHHLEFFNASVGTYLFSRSTNPDSHGDFAVL